MPRITPFADESINAQLSEPALQEVNVEMAGLKPRIGQQALMQLTVSGYTDDGELINGPLHSADTLLTITRMRDDLADHGVVVRWNCVACIDCRIDTNATPSRRVI